MSARATRLAGANRSSPYSTMEWEMSSISTVAHEDLYSAWCTIKSP